MSSSSTTGKFTPAPPHHNNPHLPCHCCLKVESVQSQHGCSMHCTFGTQSVEKCLHTEKVYQIEQFLANMQLCRGVQDEKVVALRFASFVSYKEVGCSLAYGQAMQQTSAALQASTHCCMTAYSAYRVLSNQCTQCRTCNLCGLLTSLRVRCKMVTFTSFAENDAGSYLSTKGCQICQPQACSPQRSCHPPQKQI